MKTYTFDLNKTNNNTFHNNNYSKIIDDLILADLIDKNKYLKNTYSNDATTGDIYLDKMIGITPSSSCLKDTDEFINAANFLANYNTGKNHKFPYKYGTTYKLTDGTPIIFFEDSIQIGFDLYYFDDFKNINFLNTINTNLKSTIISIYTNGLKISIIK